MANEDYLKDFVPGVIIPYIHTDEDGGMSSRFRPVTERERALREEMSGIRKHVSTIFQLGKSTDEMLTDIERDVAALAAKVKQYAEGAS